MTSLSKATSGKSPSLEGRDLAEYGIARFRDQVFDAVLMLWRRRKKEGWTQKQLADVIGRDPGWVSRNLRAPGNWTIRTAGELIQALNAEAEITISALEDATMVPTNFDAYDGYTSSPDLGTEAVALNPSVASVNIGPEVMEQFIMCNSQVGQVEIGGFL